MVSSFSTPGFPPVHTHPTHPPAMDARVSAAIDSLEASVRAAFHEALDSAFANFATKFATKFSRDWALLRRGLVLNAEGDSTPTSMITISDGGNSDPASMCSEVAESIEVGHQKSQNGDSNPLCIPSTIHGHCIPPLLSSSPLLRALATLAVKPQLNDSVAAMVSLLGNEFTPPTLLRKIGAEFMQAQPSMIANKCPKELVGMSARYVFVEIPDSCCCVVLDHDMFYCKGIQDKGGGFKFRPPVDCRMSMGEKISQSNYDDNIGYFIKMKLHVWCQLPSGLWELGMIRRHEVLRSFISNLSHWKAKWNQLLQFILAYHTGVIVVMCEDFLNEKFGWINWYLVGKFVKTDGSAFDLFDEMSNRGSEGTMETSQMKDKNGWFSSLRDLIRKLKIMEMEHIKLSDEALTYKKCLEDMNGMRFPYSSTLNQQVNLHNDLKTKFIEGANEQTELYNKVLELKGNIRIFFRGRPLNNEEVAARASMAIDFESAKDGERSVKSNGVTRRTFKFDVVFGPQVEQADVFEDTTPFATSIFDGYNVCIFAYGQTESGKTFTVEGTEEARGIHFRTLQELFRVGARLAEAYSVNCGVVAYFEDSGVIVCMLMQHLSSNIPHSGLTLIHHAILCNNERAAEVLISCGADVEVPIQTTNSEPECPVHMASRLRLNKVIQRLISAGCNINSWTESGETALMTCARYKHQECLKILASDCVDFGLANCAGQSASVIAESSRWALGLRQAVVVVLRSGEIVQSSDTSKFSLVMLVTQANDVETLKKLIVGAGVDLNEQDEKGYSAAMVAAEAGYLEIFKLIIDAGADINLQNKNGQMIMELFVTNQDSEEFEKSFLKNAAPQKVLDSLVEFYGTLHMAVQHGDTDFVHTLVSKGSDMIASEANGYTPLMLATGGFPATLCELLITLGAKWDVATARHETTLLLARKIGIKNHAENVILDELARSIVLGGYCEKKHTKCGRGSPHRKMLKMVGATELLQCGSIYNFVQLFLVVL